MFDLSITKLLFLAVLALVIFGPNELPRIAKQAGRALRELRQIAEGAKADLRDGLGPEFQDFDFEDLNPKRFVAKHLFDDEDLESAKETTVSAVTAVKDAITAPVASSAAGTPAAAAESAADDRPPFDLEAT